MKKTVKQIVERQADDASLWFEAQHITESILQLALRELHVAIEREQPAPVDKANVALATESAMLRGLLSELVEAVDGMDELDEQDGPQFSINSDRLEDAINAARKYTEAEMVKSALKNEPAAGAVYAASSPSQDRVSAAPVERRVAERRTKEPMRYGPYGRRMCKDRRKP